MNRLKTITLAVLAVIDVAAAGFAWRSVAGDAAVVDLPRRASAAIMPAAPSDEPVAAPGDDPETLARPLFTKSRRPWRGAQDAASDGDGSPPPAGLKLHAIIAFDRSTRAFVTSDADAQGRWLRVGETFESWTVAGISRQDISLRLNASLLHFGLDYDDAARAAPEPPPAPPPRGKEGDERPPPAKIVSPKAFDGMRAAKRGEH
ncbi:hypothetical protein K9U39_12950 [Rhodoblastus acidophilus]|uniref:Type II secretion system protein GspC N-terminal domain-containing protein n=1 Tax=Candidatus Rhodoblastus alkanivorans TaxID=2954117 RepID=A0ABS9ZA43_9HYPH|nr:hypothetical protein [Candidatus Rhodoblastus alkanivorans]MCI4677165.1 hypothetical protein [Candidatus Rhodoblastus alkanivorans]MCI4684518.1 hypothetical protein [Candidatus Rhodoblastus alkanivorans]MDI4641839.1 hypothetical protein [Rhodoblastus acidophilus]